MYRINIRFLLYALIAIVATSTLVITSVHAEENWALYGNNYDNNRFSNLSQINKRNVVNLKLAWKSHTGIKDSFQASPIVIDGTMYITTPFNDVIALEASTGNQIWRYHHRLTTKQFCCGPVNRGVGVANGKVFMATIDNRLIALEQSSGKVIWDIPITNSDPGVREVITPLLGKDLASGANVAGGTGYGANLAPQVFDGKVFVGITGAGFGLHLNRKEKADAALSIVGLSGGDNGLRGFIAAFDEHTGKELWRWHAVQDDRWVGEWRISTPDGATLNRDIAGEKKNANKWRNSWRIGGGSIWSTPAIDTHLRLLYIGTGNPAPPMDDATRPGDNLYTSSIVALNLDTGKLAWHYQMIPHDRWGYDVSNPPLLLSVDRGGQVIPAVATAGKTGWVYTLDRLTGELIYKSEAFVPQKNMFALPTDVGTEIAPAILGGASWSPSAWDSNTRKYFVEGVHHPATYFVKQLKPEPDRPWSSYTYMELSTTERAGTLSAVNSDTGAISWQYKSKQPMVGGVVATAGGLVFAGEGDGTFNAFDSENGQKLWTYQTEPGVNAPPVTYTVNGKQYIAVAAGGNWQFNYKGGDEILVFSLPDK